MLTIRIAGALIAVAALAGCSQHNPPAPPELVAAGVKAAQCLRQHGLSTYRDPTASTPYTPGHGFGIQAQDLPPAADKGTPTVQSALQVCRSLLDDEITASRLDHLA